VHQARVEFAASSAEWRRETFRRVDQLLWKADTALEIAAAARLDLGNTLTKLRAQVKQSSEESTKATAVQTKAAAVTVAKALDQAIQAAAGDPITPPTDPAAERPPIIVNAPPALVLKEPPPEPPKVQVEERPPKRRRWSRLWHWW
jgi:hypothetical protein